MSDFQAAIGSLLSREGGAFVPDDHGRGPSKWGVTLATAREVYPNCTEADIARMDPVNAAEFYRLAFWERYHLGLIRDQALAEKVFDLAVNMGGGTAVKILQHAAGVIADGVLGPKTAATVNAVDPGSLLAAVRVGAEQHYRDIVAAHQEWANCLDGWLARLAKG